MYNSKKVFILAGVVSILLVLSLIISFLPKNHEEGGKEEQQFTMPEYVQMDSDDTFKGPVEILGEWHGSITEEDTITFSADKTYTSSTNYARGTYEVGEGYVVLRSEYDTVSVLRIVMKEDGNLYLQQDMESLPITYQMHESTPRVDDNEEPVIDEDILRFALSTFHQVLEKSEWKSTAAEYDEVRFASGIASLLKNGVPVGEWTYSIQMAYINEADYSAQMIVNGTEYSAKIIWKGEYGEDGYQLNIDSLLTAESYEPVNLEQPT